MSDPQQVEKDRYECMKENSALADHLTANRAGVRAEQSIEVDPQLFEACMRARGYAVAPRRDRAGHELKWIRRPAESQGLVVEAEVGAGSAYGVNRWAEADLSPLLDGSPSALDLDPSAALDSEIGLNTRFGLVLRRVPHLDLGLWVGARRTEVRTEVDCAQYTGAYDVDNSLLCDSNYVSSLVPTLAMGVRARPPSAPRLWAGAELAVQPVGPASEIEETFEVTASGADEPVDVTLRVAATDRVLVPAVRLNLGVDLVHPDPLGVALSCGAEVVLHDAVISGEADQADGPVLGGGCALTARLSPRGPAR